MIFSLCRYVANLPLCLHVHAPGFRELHQRRRRQPQRERHLKMQLRVFVLSSRLFQPLQYEKDVAVLQE